MQQIQVPRATDSGRGESNGARQAKIIVPSVVGGLIVIAALLACLLVCTVNMWSCVLVECLHVSIVVIRRSSNGPH